MTLTASLGSEEDQTNDGGLEQQRQPGTPDESPVKEPEAGAANALNLDDHDADPAGDSQIMDKARTPPIARNAYAIDDGDNRSAALGLDF